jgi:hypothetical protein
MTVSIRDPCSLRTLRSAFLLCLLFLTASASAALAQSRGTVIPDQATIWRLDAVGVPLTVVKKGIELELTARSDRWYEVILPPSLGGRGERGLIAVSQVQLVAGSPPPPVRPLGPGSAPPQRSAQTSASQQGAFVRGFGQLGVMSFAAKDTFKAVLGESRGTTFGGGVQVRSPLGLYLQLGVERFRETGERVFVLDNEVFPLGVPNTITVIPITLSMGYRFLRGSIVPYAGGGVGSYLLREKTPFDEEGESVKERHTGYHAIGGLEVRGTGWLAGAVEAQYAHVPDALGSNGASQAFDEHNLGGFQAQLKILVGR